MKSNSLSITLLAAGLAAGWVGAANLPNGLPILNSKPSAPVAFFLDFGAFGGFDRDGDPTTFNASEQAEIEHAWAQTATAYSPYDANVTTISPAAGVPFTWIGIGADGGNGSAGTRFFIPWSAQPSSPVARLGSWRLPGANTIIHEGNHSIGIGHSFYYDDKLSLVIAQFIHGERRAAWTTAAGSMGEFKNGLSQYGTPSNPAGYYWPIRDIDFICKAVINATKTYVDAGYTGDGLRPDDHGDDIAHATPLVPGSGVLSADGVIERQTDKDVFSFAWGGGEIWVGVQASLPRAQLDARITLRDAAGNLIAHADPPNQWDAAVHIDDLPAGSYFAEVASDGDYSDLGWYRVTAAGDPPPFLQPVASLDFEDSPGATTFADASSYGHDGQLDLNGGVATPASGPDASGALNLSGPARVLIQQHGKSLNNQYGALATGADGLTFTLAFRPDNAEAAGKQVLIDAYNGTGVVIYLEGGRLKAHAYRAAGSISPESNCTLTSTPVSSHEWHHLTVSLFQTSGRVDDAMRLYLDGELVARGTAAEVTEIGPMIAIGNASGVVRFPDGTTTYAGFGGAIDRFRFYHEVLPDPMIADLALRPDLRQPAPTGTAVAGSATPASDSVTLNWNPVAGATAYQILRSEDAQHYAPLALLDAGETAFHDPGLEPSHRYFYCVAAQGAEGVATIQTKTRAAAPILAGLLPVQKANADPDYQWTDYERWGNHAEGIHGITLNWVQPQGDADRQIRIERSTDGVNFTPLRTMSSLYTVYYDNTVAPDTVYTYRLVSIDDQGDAGAIRFLAQSTGPNRAPVLVAPVGAVAFDEYGTAIVIDLSTVFADAQVAPLQIEVTANDNPGFVTAALDGTLLTLTCAPGALGSATLTVRATDIGGLETADTFTVTRTSLPPNPPPLLGTPFTTAIFADGATVTCPLSQAPATANTVVWAYADQGDSDVAAWQSAPGGGSASLGPASPGDTLSHTITGLDATTSYTYRFFTTGASGYSWSAARSFPTGVTLDGVITPIEAMAVNSIDASRRADKLIDGSGLSGSGDILTRTHSEPGNTSADYFLGSATGNGIVFTLPAAATVAAAHLWQYDRPGLTSRGFNTFDVSFSTDGGVSFPTTITLDLAQGTGSPPTPVQTLGFAQQSGVTHIRFHNITNYGDASWIGLSEVRFGSVGPLSLAQPTSSDIQPAQATVSTSVSQAVDAVTVYWDTLDHGPGSAGWSNTAGIGPRPAGAISHLLTGLAENVTYFVRFHATGAGGEVWSLPGSLTTSVAGSIITPAAVTATSSLAAYPIVNTINSSGLNSSAPSTLDWTHVATPANSNNYSWLGTKAGNVIIYQLPAPSTVSSLYYWSYWGGTASRSLTAFDISFSPDGVNYSTPSTITLGTPGSAAEFFSLGTHANVTHVRFSNLQNGGDSLAGIGEVRFGGQPSAPGGPFGTWAAGPWSGTLTDDSPALDFDGGGLETGIEWVVGGDPTDGSDDVGNAPTIDNSNATHFIFTFKRRDAAGTDADTDIAVEYGSNLGGWAEAVHGTNGVTIDDSTDLGGGFHQVTVSIPRTLAGDGGKLFARLKVVVSTTP